MTEKIDRSHVTLREGNLQAVKVRNLELKLEDRRACLAPQNYLELDLEGNVRPIQGVRNKTTYIRQYQSIFT